MTRFSVVTPIRPCAPRAVRGLVDSLSGQTFADWQHCLVADGALRAPLRQVLDDAARDPRVVASRAAGGFADTANHGLALATGEFVAVVDHTARLRADAFALIDATLAAEPDIDFLYTDEDRLDIAGRHRDPFLKPDWSPNRFRCQPYTGQLWVARASLVDAVGGFRPRCAGAEDWDLLFRIVERARRIAHLPEIVYSAASSWRGPSRVLPRAARTAPAAARAAAEHCRRLQVAGAPAPLDASGSMLRLRPALAARPSVSIVIPTAGSRREVDGRDTLLAENAVRSIVERSDYDNYEIVIVADSVMPDRDVDAVRQAGAGRVAVVPYAKPFNFSDKINVGAAAAQGDHLLLLNDDIEVQSPSWMEAMLMYALIPPVGAVGARLHYPDGRLQHAGVISVGGRPTHALHRARPTERGYFGSVLLPADVLAVTGACLLTRRAVFRAIGGFDPAFPINYNDVDYCLRLGAHGYRCVYTPEAQLIHHESATRTPGPVSAEERDSLRRRWGAVLARDPYYSPRFELGSITYGTRNHRAGGAVTAGAPRTPVSVAHAVAREFRAGGLVRVLHRARALPRRSR